MITPIEITENNQIADTTLCTVIMMMMIYLSWQNLSHKGFSITQPEER